MAETIRNPFLTQGYVSPEYFCDRQKETEELTKLLPNGWNVTLVAPRRMGKTGLIHNVFYQMRHESKQPAYIYIDIFGTKNLHDFVEKLSEAILTEVISKGESLFRKALSVLSSIRPVVGVDQLSGTPTVSVSLDPTVAEPTLKSALGYLKDCGREVFVAIDEFQEITEYPETGLEAELRSYIQFLHNVHFIFSGSKRHLMMEMFMSPKRPFYQSTRIMDLKAIDEEAYYDFAEGFFKKKGGSLSKEIFHSLYTQFYGHTWYLQAVLKNLYGERTTVDSAIVLASAIKEQVDSNAPYFENVINLIPDKQYEVLRAVAKERVVAEPTNGKFISQYHLKSASSVASAIRSLTDKELLYHTAGGYIVYDRFFSIWLAER